MNSNLQAILERDKSLCDKATKGPWKSLGAISDVRLKHKIGNDWFTVAKLQHFEGIDTCINNGEFIAEARTLLPRYIEAVEKLVELFPHRQFCSTQVGGSCTCMRKHEMDLITALLSGKEGE